MTARRKRRAKRIAAWVILYAAEVVIALIPAAAAAAILIPWVLADRGYFAVGGEWIAVGLIFYLTYVSIHNIVCSKIYGKEEA